MKEGFNMFYDLWTGGLTAENAFNAFLELLGLTVNFGAYQEAFDFFSNFASNIGTALSNPSVEDIVKIIPDFASTVVQIIPGLQVASIVAQAYDIATLL